MSHVIHSNQGDGQLRARLDEIYSALQNIEADKGPAKAAVILSGLGFSPHKQQRPTRYVHYMKILTQTGNS